MNIKLGLEQSEVTPVEMEVAKSVKQESRGFSHERFNIQRKISNQTYCKSSK